MAGLQLGGLASGMDTEGVIAQLMQLEAQPGTRWAQQKKVSEARESALRDILSRVKNLQNEAKNLKSVTTWADTQTVESSDTAKITATRVGGAAPGGYDKATLGQPAKYSFCLAENEEENPWEPLHVERGLEREADVVSAFGCSGVNSAVDMASQSAKGLLKTFALTMIGGFTSGVTSTETLLVICPEHAAILANSGYSKAAIRKALFESARVPHEKISQENLQLLANRRPQWFQGAARELPVIDRPEDLWILVAGGKGAKSAYIPGRTGTKLQTAAVDMPAISCRCDE